MPPFDRVKEENGVTLEVSTNFRSNSFEVPKLATTKSYTKENVAGIKRLSVTFMVSKNVQTLRTTYAASLSISKEILGTGWAFQSGAELDADAGEVVIPLILTDKKSGFAVGVEIKATVDPLAFSENGLNFILSLPMLGRIVTLKVNPGSRNVTVQFAASHELQTLEQAMEKRNVNYYSMAVDRLQNGCIEITEKRTKSDQQQTNVNYNAIRDNSNGVRFVDVLESVADVLTTPFLWAINLFSGNETKENQKNLNVNLN
ncbi:unnamed protein product, partial [Mesorhabditis belari]|uniref:Uncharacterized protein n=1 Tax=Mesorhabditis belari TaxID=2138241 RepID=A0AAF3FLX7_9BILA